MSNTLIFKNSIILYLRLVLTSILGIITARLLLQSLGVNDFGLYTVVSGIVLIMNILNTSLISTSFRFIAFELGKENEGNPNKILNISIALHVFMALLLLILAETLGRYYIYNYLNVSEGRLEDSFFVFRLSVISAIFSIVSIPFQGLITAKENFLIRSVIEILTAIVKLIAVLILFKYVGDKLLLFAKLMLIVSLIGPLSYYLFSKIKYGELIKYNFSKDIKTYKEFISFSTWIMFGAGASIGKIQGTAMLINSFFGTVLNASFGLANQLNTFILMFAQNIGQATIPQITKSYSSGNIERTKKLTASISKITFFLMLFPSVPLLFNTEYVLTLWLGGLPDYILIFTKLMIVNALIDSTVAGLPAAIQATGKIKYYQILLSCNMLLVLPISYFFYKYNYPAQTILFVFIGMSIFNNFLAQLFLKNILGFKLLDYFKKVYLGIVLVILLISPLYFLSSFFNKNIISFLLFCFMSTIWIIVAIYAVGLLKEEKKEIISIVLKLRKKL